jgi:hypothetical protein
MYGYMITSCFHVYDGNTRKFAIDNADTLFQHILGVPITAISINKDNPKWTGGECVEKTR